MIPTFNFGRLAWWGFWGSLAGAMFRVPAQGAAVGAVLSQVLGERCPPLYRGHRLAPQPGGAVVVTAYKKRFPSWAEAKAWLDTHVEHEEQEERAVAAPASTSNKPMGVATSWGPASTTADAPDDQVAAEDHSADATAPSVVRSLWDAQLVAAQAYIMDGRAGGSVAGVANERRLPWNNLTSIPDILSRVKLYLKTDAAKQYVTNIAAEYWRNVEGGGGSTTTSRSGGGGSSASRRRASSTSSSSAATSAASSTRKPLAELVSATAQGYNTRRAARKGSSSAPAARPSQPPAAADGGAAGDGSWSLTRWVVTGGAVALGLAALVKVGVSLGGDEAEA